MPHRNASSIAAAGNLARRRTGWADRRMLDSEEAWRAILEVAANAVDNVALLVEEVRDRFERRFQLDTLLDELQVRETDLGSLLSHDWCACA